MKIEIRSADLMHISGYVNAVERDSKQLPASMAPGMTTPFVERIVSGTFAKSLKDHPKVERDSTTARCLTLQTERLNCVRTA